MHKCLIYSKLERRLFGGDSSQWFSVISACVGSKTLIVSNYIFKDIFRGNNLGKQRWHLYQTFRTHRSLFPTPGKTDEEAPVLHPLVQAENTSEASS